MNSAFDVLEKSEAMPVCFSYFGNWIILEKFRDRLSKNLFFCRIKTVFTYFKENALMSIWKMVENMADSEDEICNFWLLNLGKADTVFLRFSSTVWRPYSIVFNNFIEAFLEFLLFGHKDSNWPYLILFSFHIE